MTNPTQDTSRWLDPKQYNKDWGERSSALMNLLIEKKIETRDFSFTEYGCGPYAPFTRKFSKLFENNIQVDIKKWSEETIVCDLNKNQLSLPKTDIGVFSGVLEYVNDINFLFARMRNNHERILFSYAFRTKPQASLTLPKNKKNILSAKDSVSTIKMRAIERGWRNHFDIDSIIQICSSFGYIENIDLWNEHVIFLIKNSSSINSNYF